MSSVHPATVTCALRQYRVNAGLSQNALAGRAGVSRQALIAIEAGRQVPSTTLALQLARALRCSVEELFTLDDGRRVQALLASTRMANTTRVALASVDERWVAHPTLRCDQPGDGVVVGIAGKPNYVDVHPMCSLDDAERNVLVAGCAPLLGVLTGRLGRNREDARATWIAANSTYALELLGSGLVHVAGLHLAGDAQQDHAAVVRQRFPKADMTVVNLTRWRQGLVLAKGNPLAIRTIGDFTRPDVRVVRREAGAGAQQLLERWAKREGRGDVTRDGPVASGHAEVAQLIRLGLADAGVAIEAVALAEGLDFVPLEEERFDLIVPTARLEQRPVARLFELVGAAAFQSEARGLPGYDLSIAGHASSVQARAS